MFKLLSICSLLIISWSGISSAKRPGIQSRIVGGVISSINDFKYQASILVHSVHHCGGSIISPTLILTANHCVEGRTKSEIKVRVGSTSWNGEGDGSGGILLYVNRIIEHDLYDTVTVDNDIAILELEQSLEKYIKNGMVSVIKLANQPISNLVGQNCVVSGWGKLADDGRYPNRLRSTKVEVFKQATCDSLLSMSVNTFCAGYLPGGIDSCEGDSGGPFVCGDRQVGIVSWGNGCGQANKPGVYVDVNLYSQWITDVMNKYN